MTTTKTNVPGIVRDNNTGTLLNRNMKDLETYRINRKRALQSKDIDKRLNKIEDDMSQIKELLGKLVNGHSSI